MKKEKEMRFYYKGDIVKGKEIIAILENYGGENKLLLNGRDKRLGYFIGRDNIITAKSVDILNSEGYEESIIF